MLLVARASRPRDQGRTRRMGGCIGSRLEDSVCCYAGLSLLPCVALLPRMENIHWRPRAAPTTSGDGWKQSHCFAETTQWRCGFDLDSTTQREESKKEDDTRRIAASMGSKRPNRSNRRGRVYSTVLQICLSVSLHVVYCNSDLPMPKAEDGKQETAKSAKTANQPITCCGRGCDGRTFRDCCGGGCNLRGQGVPNENWAGKRQRRCSCRPQCRVHQACHRRAARRQGLLS